jgi:hypothetical protein
LVIKFVFFNLICESLLAEIATATKQAEEKKAFALSKSKEIEEQSKIIFVEKVN